MMVCIQQAEENGHSLTWDDVASLVKESHCNADRNAMSMVLVVVSQRMPHFP